MKLKTSFFKGVTLKKDILRFAPIWALYLIGMLMVLLEMGSYGDYDNFARNRMPGLVVGFGVVNLCYAGICANLLFGDLYNTKLCYSLHAMPYRRESWLLTHLVSGLLFSLVPNLIASLYLMFVLESYWFLALYWLLAMTLQYLFFYGVASVSVLLTGNRFAMLLVYAGFNFVAMLLYATVNVIYIPMLEGVIANLEDFSIFSPVVRLFSFDYFTFTRIENKYQDIYDITKYFYRYDGLADGWGYLAILGVMGLAAMAASFWLYRRRHLESAGDFVAFPKLKSIACVIMTLCVALCFALVGELFGSYIAWLIVGLIVGFFGSLMLLERRLRVFRKKTFLGFAAMALAVTLSLLSVYCDWFGIESWTPKADRVQSVTVSNTRYDRYYDGMRVTLEEEADIAQIIAAHQDILDRVDGNYSSYHTVCLTYKMKSGRTVVRYYHAPATGQGYAIVRSYLYNTDSVLGFTDAAQAAPNVRYMYCSKGQIPAALYEAVLGALQTDCKNGYVLMDSDIGGEYYIEYTIENENGQTVYRSLRVLSGAPHIGPLMKGPEITMGYSDWSEFLASIEKLAFASEGLPGEVPKADREGLLTALRKDIENGSVQANEYASNGIILYYEHRYPDGEYNYREFCITTKAENTMTWLAENEYIPKEEPHD